MSGPSDHRPRRCGWRLFRRGVARSQDGADLGGVSVAGGYDTPPGSTRAAMRVGVTGFGWIVGASLVSLVTGEPTVGALVCGAGFVVAASLAFWRTPRVPLGRLAAVWVLAVVLVGVVLRPVAGGAWELLLGACLLYGTIATVALLGPVLLFSQLFPGRPTD